VEVPPHADQLPTCDCQEGHKQQVSERVFCLCLCLCLFWFFLFVFFLFCSVCVIKKLLIPFTGSKSCVVEGEDCDIGEVADKLKDIMDDTAKTQDTVSKKAVNVSIYSDKVAKENLQLF
jgi:hypothetical protein